ncbi:442_t:CDS:2 [Gigaspora rosea]|nr:442_t:CDS:2 [Gigaspora rosea]
MPGISLSFNPNIDCIPELRVPTCTSCKKPSSRFPFPHLSPMSKEITSVPLHKRKYLSSIYLHCFLGRTPNSNSYSEYRSLIGTMNYSHNIRAYALYSGIIVNNSIYNDETLHCATNWLAQNNSYLHSLANNLVSNERIHKFNDPFPRATHIPTNSNALAVNPSLTIFGEITNFFDRIEFQNRGAAYTHSCYWTTIVSASTSSINFYEA